MSSALNIKLSNVVVLFALSHNIQKCQILLGSDPDPSWPADIRQIALSRRLPAAKINQRATE